MPHPRVRARSERERVLVTTAVEQVGADIAAAEAANAYLNTASNDVGASSLTTAQKATVHRPLARAVGQLTSLINLANGWLAGAQDNPNTQIANDRTAMVLAINAVNNANVLVAASRLTPTQKGAIHTPLAEGNSTLKTAIAAAATWLADNPITPPPPAPPPPPPTPRPSFVAVASSDALVTVAWANVTPVKLGRNGTDSFGTGPWDTSQLSPPPTFRSSGTYVFGAMIPSATYQLTLTEASGATLTADITMPAPPTPPTPPGPPGTGPSGVAMPSGDIDNGDGSQWIEVFADNFTKYTVELGSMYSGQSMFAGQNGWTAYPHIDADDFHDTSGNGLFMPADTIQVNTTACPGVMDFRFYTDPTTGRPWVGEATPLLGGPGVEGGFKYLRTAERFRADTSLASLLPGYKIAHLWWPDSEIWPSGDELDGPECDLNGNIAFYWHYADENGNDAAYYILTGVPVADGNWHTVTKAWTPQGIRVFVDYGGDGNPIEYFWSYNYDDPAQVALALSRMPPGPMNVRIQNESNLDGTFPDSSIDGHLQLAWFVASRYAAPDGVVLDVEAKSSESRPVGLYGSRGYPIMAGRPG